MKKNWYGIEITDQISLTTLEILLNKKTIVIISRNLESFNGFLEFIGTLKFLSKLPKKKEISFGLFLDPSCEMIRKKIKNEFIENISQKSVISLLEGDNLEAYYYNKHKTIELLGIETRLEESLDLTKEEILLGITKEIGKERSNIFWG